MDEGTRVRLRQDVERYPHFVAESGLTGTIVTAAEERVAVQLDEHLDGAEEWDNRVEWYADWYDEVSLAEAVERDLEPIE